MILDADDMMIPLTYDKGGVMLWVYYGLLILMAYWVEGKLVKREDNTMWILIGIIVLLAIFADDPLPPR